MDAYAMNNKPMDATALAAALLHALPFALLGLGLGYLYFATLRWNTQLYVRHAPLWQSLGLQLLRLGIATAAMVLVARFGALPLLLTLAGLLLGRHVVLRQVRAS
jgi:F1F0 ATPase subunit 2